MSLYEANSSNSSLPQFPLSVKRACSHPPSAEPWTGREERHCKSITALPWGGAGRGKEVGRCASCAAGTAERTLEHGFSTTLVLKNEETWVKGKKLRRSGERAGKLRQRQASLGNQFTDSEKPFSRGSHPLLRLRLSWQ